MRGKRGRGAGVLPGAVHSGDTEIERRPAPNRSSRALRSVATRAIGAALAGLLAGGCLSNSYAIRQDELVRLAQLPPDQRWQAVRAVQHVGGSDDPPEDAPPPTTTPMALVRPAVIASAPGDPASSTLVSPGLPPPRLFPAPPGPPLPFSGVHGGAFSLFGGSNSGSGGASSSGGGGGGSGGGAAVLIAALVVGVAVAGIILIPTEGMRYDGWVAVNPDESLYLRAENGERFTVPLSALTPEIAQAARVADVFEGADGRFLRLGRAPLDRRNFHLGAAVLGTGVPQHDRSMGIGVGGHVNLGWNFANVVSVGASLDATASPDSHGAQVLFAGVGPEVMFVPLPWAGLYVGGGWAYRDTWAMGGGELRHAGYYLRAGFLGELPLTTRLSLQLRAGAMRADVGDAFAPVTVESSLGFAVY